MDVEISMSSKKAFCHLHLIDDDGSVYDKNVLLKDLFRVFEANAKEEWYYAVPEVCRHMLPEGKKHVDGLILGQKNMETVKGLFFIPSGINYFNFAGEQMTIPYPSMLMYLSAVAGQLRLSQCYAVKETALEDLRKESLVYAFPFGNVSPETGNICWGSNAIPQILEFEDLHNLVITFFSSESNADYVRDGGSYAKGSYASYQDMIRRISKRKSFPTQILIPSKARSCVGNILEQF